MNPFRFYILFWLALLPTSSLAGMVGGTCTYEVMYGTAQIIEQEHGKIMARFEPGTQQFHKIDLPISRFLIFPVQLPIAGEVGTIYPAELAIISKGSCPPARTRLLATETYSRGVFIKNDGSFSLPPTLTTSKQLAIIFNELVAMWPQLTVDICGQTSQQGSAEYNLNLGEHQARQVALQLEKYGVPPAQIQTSSHGEHPCPRSTASIGAPQNGVWLSFLLTSPSTQ